MGYYDRMELEVLVGKKVLRIWWSETVIVFETNHGQRSFLVDGDCCSYSYFYDFYGVEKLLNNGAVISVNDIELGEDGYFECDHELIQVYGYQLVTEHPVWGEQTSALSFRNASNGYYGGNLSYEGEWLYSAEKLAREFELLTTDKIGD